MSKDPTGLIRTDERFTPEFTQLDNRGHAMHAVVRIEEGKTFLHVINFYGQTGARNSKALKSKSNSWLETILTLLPRLATTQPLLLAVISMTTFFLIPSLIMQLNLECGRILA